MCWIPGWSYEENDFSLFPIYAENETQRLWFLNNVASSSVRVNFSNIFGNRPLKIDCATIARVDENGSLLDAPVELLFNGEQSLCLDAFQNKYCDETSFSVSPGEWISVSIFIKEKTRIATATTSHSTYVSRISAEKGGNFCYSLNVLGERFLDNAKEFMFVRPSYKIVSAIVNSVEFLASENVKTIGIIGDSITQHGYWTEALTKRLYEQYPGEVTIFNRGICGNKVLHDASIRTGMGRYFGISLLDRFENDIFSNNKKNCDLVIVQEGVNDILNPVEQLCPASEVINAEQMIAAYKKVSLLAKKHGSKIIGCTLMPFKGFHTVSTKETEALKDEINFRLRRNEAGFDEIFDFATVLAEPSDMQRLIEEYTIDHLHPNQVGGTKLAESIDLEKMMTL